MNKRWITFYTLSWLTITFFMVGLVTCDIETNAEESIKPKEEVQHYPPKPTYDMRVEKVLIDETDHCIYGYYKMYTGLGNSYSVVSFCECSHNYFSCSVGSY